MAFDRGYQTSDASTNDKNIDARWGIAWHIINHIVELRPGVSIID